MDHLNRCHGNPRKDRRVTKWDYWAETKEPTGAMQPPFLRGVKVSGKNPNTPATKTRNKPRGAVPDAPQSEEQQQK